MFSGGGALDRGKETAKFLICKYKRIFPYFLFGWILAFGVMCMDTSLTFQQIAKNVILSIWQILFMDMAGMDGYLMTGATWYLSSMFLVMPVMFWLLLNEKNFFSTVGTGLIPVFIYGYLQKRAGAPLEVYAWNHFFYLGTLRAVAGLSLGCFCFKLYKELITICPTKLLRCILTFIEIGGYVATLFLMARPYSGANPFSFITVLIFSICITISFSSLSFTAGFFSIKKPGNYRMVKCLGPFSTALYLSHGRMQAFVIRAFPHLTTFAERFPRYLLFSILFGICNLLFTYTWTVLFNKYGEKLKRMLVYESSK